MLLTDAELKVISNHPEVLRLLVDYHDVQATMAEASDYHECVPFHDKRIDELNAEIARLDKEWN